MAIYMTGDTHGDFRRFKREIFTELAGLTKDDFVIICGDFGGVWGGGAEENHWLDWLDKKSFTTLFVTGNHENYELLAKYPVSEWHGGKAQFIRPSIIHLMRGQVYDIAGKRFFTMGGASSHDIRDGILEPDDPDFERKRRALDARWALYRVNHVSWWKEELPNRVEYAEAKRNLRKARWDVDYIVTHCCPSRVQDSIKGGRYERDALTDFFDLVAERCRFKYWFFGHYHDNRVMEGKYVLLYEQIVRVEG